LCGSCLSLRLHGRRDHLVHLISQPPFDRLDALFQKHPQLGKFPNGIPAGLLAETGGPELQQEQEGQVVQVREQQVGLEGEQGEGIWRWEVGFFGVDRGEGGGCCGRRCGQLRQELGRRRRRRGRLRGGHCRCGDCGFWISIGRWQRERGEELFCAKTGNSGRSRKRIFPLWEAYRCSLVGRCVDCEATYGVTTFSEQSQSSTWLPNSGRSSMEKFPIFRRFSSDKTIVTENLRRTMEKKGFREAKGAHPPGPLLDPVDNVHA